jgi:uncharacterized protein (TIGR03083 family)
MSKPQPILVAQLFPPLERKLIELLRSLSAADWQAPTICRLWSVKDIAAHLLDGSLRRLSLVRDRYQGETPGRIASYDDLVIFLNRLNADWVKAARRISPQALIELLEPATKEVCELVASLDPFAPALFPVAWAGEKQSSNWFDIAREYTERWHHQQQIRLAVNRPGIMDRELYHPVLETFLRALPHGFRSVTAAEGASLEIEITGEAGGAWLLRKSNGAWELSEEARHNSAPNSEVVIDQQIAWRLFTKGIDRELAVQQIKIRGDQSLGSHILNIVAVMA